MSLHRYQPITKQPSSRMLPVTFVCVVHSLAKPRFCRDLWVVLASGQEGTY